MIPESARRKLKDLLGEYYSDRPEDLVLYGSDATNDPSTRASGVARPGDTTEAAQIVRLARDYGFPVVPRGAGSGLTGGALPIHGGLVVVMSRFNRILEVDAANLTAVVQPGVITADFQAEAERHGLFYPPDPASREFSSLGGNAAENAGGTRAVKYGVTRDYILGLEAVIGAGDVIRAGMRTAKGVVGYDLTWLMVGSEGTLGIITELTLRLRPKPETKATAVAYFHDMNHAARAVAAMTAAQVIPATLEFMDQSAIRLAENYLHIGLDTSAGALLLIETDGSLEAARLEAETAVRICGDNEAKNVRMAKNAQDADQMWQARRALSPAVARQATGRANEDIVVPRSLIPDMLERVEEIQKRCGLEIISFGHAGDGNIHTNILFEKDDPSEVERAEAALRDLFRAALDLGGTISGEHGVGTTKKDFIDMELQPQSLDLMRRIKAAFDPAGIMNPGKIFPHDVKPLTNP